MSVLLNLILITSIWCLGLTIVSQEDMIFFKVRLWAIGKLDKGYKVFKPLIVCVYCMPSIHTFFGFAISYLLGVVKIITFKTVLLYPVVAVGSSFLNGFIWELYLLILTMKEYYSYDPNLIEEEEPEPIEHYLHSN